MRTHTWFTIGLASLLLISGCKQPDTEAMRTYKQAQNLRDQDKTQDAIRLFRRATELDPSFDKPYLDLAQIYEGLGDNDNAATYYAKFVDVTRNEQMREKARSFLEEVKAAQEESARVEQVSDLAQLPASTRQLVDQLLAKERQRAQQEFAAKQTTADDSRNKNLDELKAEVVKLSLTNEVLLDVLTQLRTERDAAQRQATEMRSKADVAELLESPMFRGNDKQLLQNLLTSRAELEQLRGTLAQQQQDFKKTEEQTVKLKQQLIELQRSGPAAAATEELQRKLRELEAQNRALAQKVASAPAAAAATGTDATVARLQQQIATLEQDKAKAQLAQRDAENLLADLKRRTDEVLSAVRTDASRDPLADNRRLRLQIAKLTSQYNELSVKQAAAEKRAQELETQIRKADQLPAGARDLAAPEFSDLSDEILKMQRTIDAQRTLLAQRDTQIASLSEQTRTQARGGVPDERLSALITDLNQQLQRKEEQITQLTSVNETLQQASRGAAATERVAQLERDASAQFQRPIGAPAITTPSRTAAPYGAASTPTLRTTTPLSGASAGASLPRTAVSTGSGGRGGHTYTVRPGDTLGLIAERVYGDRGKWSVIYRYNRNILPTANALRVGQNLYIPSL